MVRRIRVCGIAVFFVDRKLTRTQPVRVDSVVDLDGGFVVPPFGEGHSHRPSTPYFAQDASDRFLSVGVDVVAHLPGCDITFEESLDKYRIEAADATAAAKQGIVVVTTTMLSVDRAADEPERLGRMRQVQLYNLRVLRDAGVKVAAGSDQFSTNSVDEIFNLALLDVYDNRELLDILSTTTPQLIFPNRRVGHLADGSETSFLVLERNPISNLSAIRNIRIAVKDSVILKEER